jgi:uncharacterized protein (DUF433 family)
MNARVVLERVPIETDSRGVVRVAGTRVKLETIVDAFQAGATPEDIAHKHPPVALVDVYSVITYYLRHTAEVDAYVEERRARFSRLREKVAGQFALARIRERLLARQRRTEKRQPKLPPQFWFAMDQIVAAIFYLIAIPLAAWAISTAITNVLGK